jgi:hypothetical protein
MNGYCNKPYYIIMKDTFICSPILIAICTNTIHLAAICEPIL